MAYQYKREPLSPEEANHLVNACNSHEEKLVVWTLLDTGLRVSELASLTRKEIDWQSNPPRIVVHGKGGPFGTRSKRRVVPLGLPPLSGAPGRPFCPPRGPWHDDPDTPPDRPSRRPARRHHPEDLTPRPEAHLQRRLH